MNVDQSQVDLLEQFIKLLKANPAVLHMPSLSFFKEYLESLGAKIPTAAKSPRTSESKSEPEPKKEPAEAEPAAEPEPEESEESDIDCQLKHERSSKGHRCSFQLYMTMSSRSIGTWDVTVTGRHVPAYQYWEPPVIKNALSKCAMKSAETRKMLLKAARKSLSHAESLRLSLPEGERPTKTQLRRFLTDQQKKQKLQHPQESDSNKSDSDEDMKEKSNDIGDPMEA